MYKESCLDITNNIKTNNKIHNFQKKMNISIVLNRGIIRVGLSRVRSYQFEFEPFFRVKPSLKIIESIFVYELDAFTIQIEIKLLSSFGVYRVFKQVFEFSRLSSSYQVFEFISFL